VKRHDIDIISLVSGLLFAALGAVFTLHALDVFSVDVRAVPAVVLIVLGLGGIAAAVTTPARSAAPAATDPPEPPASRDSDSDAAVADRVPEP
jgi:hypothetical protein